MKSYVQPKAELKGVCVSNTLSSLNDWLSDNGLTDAGITTYVVQS